MRTSSSLNLPTVQIRSNSSPPAAYSITIARCVGVKTTYKNWHSKINLCFIHKIHGSFCICKQEQDRDFRNSINNGNREANLFEANYIRVAKGSVIYDLPSNILNNLKQKNKNPQIQIPNTQINHFPQSPKSTTKFTSLPLF